MTLYLILGDTLMPNTFSAIPDYLVKDIVLVTLYPLIFDLKESIGRGWFRVGGGARDCLSLPESCIVAINACI